MQYRHTAWLSMVFIMSFAAAALAQPQGPPRGRGNAPQGPPPQGRGAGPQLDEKQREAIRALRGQQPNPAQAEQMQKLQAQLQELLLADTPDTAKIEALKKEIATAQTNALNARINQQLQFAKILTPEQRRAMRERRSRPGQNPMGFRGPRGRGRGFMGPIGRGRGFGPMGPGVGRGFGFMGPGGGYGFRFMGPGGGRGFGPMRRRGFGPMRRRGGPGGRFMGPWGPGRGFMGPWGPWGPRREEPQEPQ